MRRVGAHVSTAGGVVNAIENGIKIDANCLQMFAGSPRLWARPKFSQVEADQFIQLAKENDIFPIFIHALYLVNLATDNPDLLKKSTDSLVADLNNGRLINSSGVIVHVGSHQGRGFEVVKNQIVNAINDILDQTKETPLIIENDAGQNGKIGSIEEINYLFDKLNNPRIKICLDTAHLFESGVDFTKTNILDEFMHNLHSLGLAKQISCIHLNDSKTPFDSHRDMHANLGEGEIGIDGLRLFVNYPDISHLPLILEVPGENKTGPDKRNIDLAKSL